MPHLPSVPSTAPPSTASNAAAGPSISSLTRFMDLSLRSPQPNHVTCVRFSSMTAFIHGNAVDSTVVEESGNGQFKQGMRFRRAAVESVSVDRLRRMTEPCVFSRDLRIPADDSFKNAFGGVVLWPRMYPRVSAGSLLLD